MSKYKLTQKTNANGTTQDIVLDASCVDGVVKSVNNTSPDANGNVNVSVDTSNCLKIDGSNTMTGVLNLKASGNNETNIGTNGIRWGTDSLPQDTNPQYICTIDAFASGGRQKWASVSDLRSKLNIPSAVTSINGLSGGSLTSPLVIKGGDATTAAKISLDHTQSGQITDDGTGTLFGFLSNNATTLTVGGNSYAINLRGTGTRPQYKGNDLALYSDLASAGGGGVTSDTYTTWQSFYDLLSANDGKVLSVTLVFKKNITSSNYKTATINTSGTVSISTDTETLLQYGYSPFTFAFSGKIGTYGGYEFTLSDTYSEKVYILYFNSNNNSFELRRMPFCIAGTTYAKTYSGSYFSIKSTNFSEYVTSLTINHL